MAPSTVLVVALALLATSVAFAGDPPPAVDLSALGDALVEAFDAEGASGVAAVVDRLRRTQARVTPWDLLEELVLRKRADVAGALAALGPEAERKAMEDYVGRRAAATIGEKEIQLWRRLREAAQTPEPAGDTVTTLVWLEHRAASLLGEGRVPEAVAAWGRFADLGERLGSRFHAIQGHAMAGYLAYRGGHPLGALDHYRRLLALHRDHGTPRDVAQTLHNLGNVEEALGRPELALTLYEEALKLKREHADPWDVAGTLIDLGIFHRRQNHPAHAQAFAEEGVGLAREAGHLRWAANGIELLGVLASDAGRLQEALARHREALNLRIGLGLRAEQASSLHNLGEVLYRLGSYGRARERLELALAIRRRLPHATHRAQTLWVLALVVEKEGDAERADALREEARALLGAPLAPPRDEGD